MLTEIIKKLNINAILTTKHTETSNGKNAEYWARLLVGPILNPALLFILKIHKTILKLLHVDVLPYQKKTFQ